LERLSKQTIATLQDNAYFRACRGYKLWQEDQDRLQSVLTGDYRRWSTTDCAAQFGNLIRREASRRAW
jgi:hypothetical protein